MYPVISGKASVSDLFAFMTLLSRSNFMLDFYILGLCPVYLTFFWELENLICNFCYQLVIFVEVPVTEDYVADKPWICLFYISIPLDSTLTIPFIADRNIVKGSFWFCFKIAYMKWCFYSMCTQPRFPVDGFLVACLFRIVLFSCPRWGF